MHGQLEGQQIGRYLIRQRLGGGGAATVYQAYDQVSGQSVALKVLPPNPDAATLDRFRREALMAGALRHPHIVRILQVGTAMSGSSAYIAMNLVEGESLASLLARYGQLRAEESCALLEPIGRALAFAHRHGVVHRDVKPSNILLRPVNVRSSSQSPATTVSLEPLPHLVVPLLSDFGIARFLDAPELTNAGRTVGTPAFMAPEQCMGSREVDGRADIYSLGTVLYRCVTGRLPFNGSTTQILHAHVFEPVVIDEDVGRMLPHQVVEILRRTLAKAPEDRYQTADDLAEDLAAVGDDSTLLPSLRDAGSGASSTITSTMTLAQAEPLVRSTPKQMQVLVSGSHPQMTPPGQRRMEDQRGRKSGPRWERVLWACLFVLLIGGGGLWSARTWLPIFSEPETEQLSLLPVSFVTFTPSPEPTGGGAAIVAANTPAAAIETPALRPSAMPTPPATPIATATPSPPAVTAQEQVPAPALPPATATPAPDIPSPTLPTPTVEIADEMVGTCSMVVDEFFLSSVSQLTGEFQLDFACPTAPARVVSGEWLPFERGMMVALDGEPLVFVYYENGTWEQVARGDRASLPNAPGRGDLPARPDIPLPFASILASDGRHLLLGEPLQSAPLAENSILQPFFGGVALGNQVGGQILFLARSKLRF